MENLGDSAPVGGGMNESGWRGDVTQERESWRQPERDGGSEHPRDHLNDRSNVRDSVRDDVVESYKEVDPDWEEPEGIRERSSVKGETRRSQQSGGQRPSRVRRPRR
jgi:hypothetical protein